MEQAKWNACPVPDSVIAFSRKCYFEVSTLCGVDLD